jgi:hypothetical protein
MNESSEELWRTIKEYIDKNIHLMDFSMEKGFVKFVFDNPNFPGQGSHASIRIREYTTTLGIDIQDYSTKLNLPEQYLASVKLFSFVEKTIAWFEKEAPLVSCRPDAIMPTGDGALLFFGENVTSLVRAINFAVLLNMYLQVTNNDVPLIGATYDGLKMPTRFTIAMGDAIMIKDPNGTNNVVGESVIRCSRILSSDKGCHFLLDKNAADNLVLNNETIQNGIQHYAQLLFSSLNCCIVSDRLTRTVKGILFEFYNLYLEYDILNLLDSWHTKRQKDGVGHVFTLGTASLNGIEFE